MFETRSPSSRAALIGGSGILIVAFACAWLGLLQAAPLHGDSSRDLLIARDLADGVALHGCGAPTAFGQYLQGTSWVDLLAIGRRAGLGVAGLEWMVRALQALAVALGILGLARVLDRRPDDPGLLAGGVVLLATIPWLTEAPILWQPMLMPLPVVLAHLALWRLLLDGRAIDAALLGLFVAWAIDVHVVAVLLAVPAAVAIPAVSRRPALAILLALAAGLGFLFLSSPTMLQVNVELVRAEGYLGIVLLGLANAALLGLFLRDWANSLTGVRRLLLVTGVELLVVALLLSLHALPNTPMPAPRYILPFAPVLLLAVALGLDPNRSIHRLQIRAGVVAGAALLIATPNIVRTDVPELPSRPDWRTRQIEQLATTLAVHGYDWPTMVERLQCSVREATLGGLAALERAPASVVPPPDEDLIFIGLPTADAARVEQLLEPERILARIEDVSGVALVLRLPARLRRSNVTVRLEGGELDEQASRWRVVELVPPPPLAHLNSQRAYPAAFEPEFGRLRLDGRPTHVTWRLPFEAGPARVVSMFPHRASPECTWRISAIELAGEPSSSIAAQSVLLPAGRRGFIELARTTASDYRVPECMVVQDDGVNPPGTIETRPDQTDLRAALGLVEPK